LFQIHAVNTIYTALSQSNVVCKLVADRKAIISHGKLKCVGSSFFLKTHFGIGYQLSYVGFLLCVLTVEHILCAPNQHSRQQNYPNS